MNNCIWEVLKNCPRKELAVAEINVVSLKTQCKNSEDEAQHNSVLNTTFNAWLLWESFYKCCLWNVSMQGSTKAIF